MTRRAYNRVILPDGNICNQHVVVTDDSGNIIAHYPLTSEEAFTEWIGGTLDLRESYQNDKKSIRYSKKH
ncbi:MAG: hypothetical protein J5486_05405 [Bacteroidaceae bacterium]|nr:hypothetical protein [Bacteroidaceae bacterium]